MKTRCLQCDGCPEGSCVSVVRPGTLKFARDLAGSIQHPLSAGGTVHRGGRKPSIRKTQCRLGENMAGGRIAFVGIPRAQPFRGARDRNGRTWMNSAVTKTLSLSSRMERLTIHPSTESWTHEMISNRTPQPFVDFRSLSCFIS